MRTRKTNSNQILISIQCQIKSYLSDKRWPAETFLIALNTSDQFNLRDLTHSSHQYPFRVLIGFLAGFTWDSSRASHQNLFMILVRIHQNHCKMYVILLAGFPSKLSVDSVQNSVRILNKILFKILP